MTNYQVKTEGFEGPLDLLLHLVDREEMDITRLSLASVADDFLVEIGLRKISLAEMSNFLVIASQLILIKSKALLPLFQFTPEEENEISDLEERLKEYREFKKRASILREKIFSGRILFAHEGGVKKGFTKKFIDPRLSGDDLKKYWQNILEKNLISEKLEEQKMENITTLEEKIVQLKDSLEKRVRICFQESIRTAKNKIEVVVTFLAVLELVKRRVVFARQEKDFGDILLEKIS